MATETPGMVCGPTTGCGQTTPMVPTRIHTVNGIEKGWQAPAACSRCGKPFGFFSLINNPPPIAPLSPWFVFASSLGEPVSQEAPSMTAEHDADLAYYEEHVRGARRDSLNRSEWPALDAEIVRIKEVRQLVQRVISSASPLSEKDVALVNELRYSAARAKVNVVLEVSEAAALCDLFARLSASAPSPEYKGSET